MEVRKPRVVVAYGVDDQTVDLCVQQRFDVGAFQLGAIVGVAYKKLNVAGPAFLLHAFDEQ